MGLGSTGSSSAELFRLGRWDDLEPYEMAPWYPIYVWYFAFRGLFQKRVFESAATLAFVTIIAIIPLFATLFCLLALAGMLEGGETVVPFVEQLFPTSFDTVLSYLSRFAESNAGAVIGLSLIAYLAVGLLLFQGVERAFNQIWMSTREWSLAHNLIAAPSLLILGPCFLGLSFATTSYVQLRLNQIGVAPSAFALTVPFITAFLVFFITNFFLPRNKVRWYAAFAGGLFTAVAFEVIKWGFNHYVIEMVFEPFERLFGELGLVPVLLVVLFTTWFVVLLGVEVAHATQNLRTLLSINAAEKRDPLKTQSQNYNPFIGVELYAPIARAFKSGDGPITERQLIEETGYSSNAIREVITILADIGALNVVHDESSGETTLIPSKQLDDILLLPLIEAFFDFEAQPNSPPLNDLYDGLRLMVASTLHDDTALMLVPPDIVPSPLRGTLSRLVTTGEITRRGTLSDIVAAPENILDVLEDVPAADPLPDMPPAVSPTRRGPVEDSSFHHLPDKPLKGTQTLGSMRAEENAISVQSQDIIIDVDDAPLPPEPISVDDTAESVEIEVGEWDDISIEDSLSDIDGPDENDLRRTSEIEMELGDELSAPPPVPDEGR